MKKLYLVPIIHTSADMGSLALFLDETADFEIGQDIWQKHKELVADFWDCVGRFLDGLDASGLKIYQDGLVADGAVGLKIVQAGISRGSKNFEIIGRLLERGAVLVKTEDTALVKEEYAHLVKIARAKSPREKETWALRYKLAQKRLLSKRDEYITRRIKETLGENETGVLFIGAYHDVLFKLPGDIDVVQVKNIARVRDYQRALSGKEDIPVSGPKLCP